MTETSRDIIAIIPARGGSKRIPDKNLLPLAGLPLVAHSIEQARAARLVREVFVSTESTEIADIARAHGASVVMRPAELAGDEASSESALLHLLDDRARLGLNDPELVVFLQCTSPIRRALDIDRAIETLLDAEADSLFSACENNRLIWAVKNENPFSVNYDYHRRQREQEMARQFRENGSIYVFRPAVLRETGNRLGGKICIYEMDYWSSFQIDTPEHVDLIKWVMLRPAYRPEFSWPEQIELVVFDFDGVMTDNTVAVTETGSEAVSCHRGDGWGIARLHEAGVEMMVLSTEAHPVVAARCRKLRLPYQQGCDDKAVYLADYLTKRRIDPAHVVYVGNDVNDLGCLELVGCPVVVADAHPSVIAVSRLLLTQRGGHGAVREFCDLLLEHLNR
ncbi:MAG: cytidylyltransferase domain-containing protein [Pyrinomonadaceae bacterium]